MCENRGACPLREKCALTSKGFNVWIQLAFIETPHARRSARRRRICSGIDTPWVLMGWGGGDR